MHQKTPITPAYHVTTVHLPTIASTVFVFVAVTLFLNLLMGARRQVYTPAPLRTTAVFVSTEIENTCAVAHGPTPMPRRTSQS